MSQDQAKAQSLSVEEAAASLLNDPEEDEQVEAGEEPEADGTEEVEEDGEEEGGEPEPRYTVKLNGEEIEVPASELVQGYQRQKDYTQKTQALAAERRRIAEEAAEVQAERAKYQEALQTIEKQILPEEPNWERLRVENPAEFPDIWAQYQQRKRMVESIQSEREKVAQLAELEQAERLKRRVAEERDLMTSAIPEWVDADKAKSERAALLEFGKTVGYTDEELAQIYDHRAIVLLRKAWLYDKARTRVPKAEEQIQKAKTAPPGVNRGTARVAGYNRAKDRLQKSGRLEDAAAVLTQFL